MPPCVAHRTCRLTHPRHTRQRAVVLEPHERRLYTMVQQLNTIRNAKVKKREEQHTRRKLVIAKKQADADVAMARRVKEEKKRRYREEGKQRAAGASKKARMEDE